jgi:type II secretory pathway predicted ATPase ExeA
VPDIASALNLEGLKFCQQIKSFCDDRGISVRGLSSICDGSMHGFSKSSAERLLKGTIKPDLLEQLRPVLFNGLRRYLECQHHMHTDEVEALLSPIFDKQEFTLMLHDRCELDPLAIRHFGLDFDPFDVDRIPSEDEVFSTPELDAVVQRVKDAVLYQRFVAVIGDIGSGKTLLKMRVAAELAKEDKVQTRLIYPEFFEMEQVEVHAIASYILSDLGQTVPRSKPERVKAIKALLDEMYYEDIRVALYIDEAHHLNDRVLTSLKNFWELSKGISSGLSNGRNRSFTNRLLGVVLFGQPQFVQSRLRNSTFREIRQRVQIIEMPKLVNKKGSKYDWTPAKEYVEHRIRLAGGKPEKIFDPEALDIICRNASTPLTIGNLVNECLTEAYELEEKTVQASFPFFKQLSAGTPQVVGMRRSA